MLDIDEITKNLDAHVQPLLDMLSECNIDVVYGTREGEDEQVLLSFAQASDVSMFITMLIQTDESESSSLTSRVLTQDSEGNNNWIYLIQIFTNLKDSEKPVDEVGFSVGAVIAFPSEDYDQVLARVANFRDMMLEPEDESCKIAGFCKGCFIVDLERLIEIDEFAILNPETGESYSGSDIESVSKNGEVVEISLAK